MSRRFLSIWFPHLRTDWFALRNLSLHGRPFVLHTRVHGRMMITATNTQAELKGIHKGLIFADARALVPDLEALDDEEELPSAILNELAAWCIRFTPTVAVDLPDGLLMEVTGCPHLWGGESQYVSAIESRLNAKGYDVRTAMAGTPRVAWAMARFAISGNRVGANEEWDALLRLPPEALRIEPDLAQRLHKLGLHSIGEFVKIPRHALRRRFGQSLLDQLDAAAGLRTEELNPVSVPASYEIRLPVLDPITSREGIEMALEKMLWQLCDQLYKNQKGLRSLLFRGFRVDGKTTEVKIGTNRPTCHVKHLIKLFENRLSSIEPGLGIELFLLEADDVEDNPLEQHHLWAQNDGLSDERLSELIDSFLMRGGINVSRYLPAEHYWPERSFEKATGLAEKPSAEWRNSTIRPVLMLDPPEKIEVTAPIPDYPPMLFIYAGNIHRIVHADGPERIEQEWWITEGQHRDYYRVEDQEGCRYWIFRLGHYHDTDYQWFIHGYFA